MKFWRISRLLVLPVAIILFIVVKSGIHKSPGRLIQREVELKSMYRKLVEIEKSEQAGVDVFQLLHRFDPRAEIYEINNNFFSDSKNVSNLSSSTWIIREKEYSHRSLKKRYLYKVRLVLYADGRVEQDRIYDFSIKELIKYLFW